MKATGIVRKVDQLGRIVLPMELRRAMDLNKGTPIEIFTDEDGIVLKKYRPGCVCCGNTGELVGINGVRLCPECIQVFCDWNRTKNGEVAE